MPRRNQEGTRERSSIKSPAVFMNKLEHKLQIEVSKPNPPSNITAFINGKLGSKLQNDVRYNCAAGPPQSPKSCHSDWSLISDPGLRLVKRHVPRAH